MTTADARALEHLEDTLGRVLTIGARASTIALAVGLGCAFLWPTYGVTRTLLSIGLGVLLLTPVARVVVSVIGYVRARDWWFVLYTGIVLGLLIASFVAAFD